MDIPFVFLSVDSVFVKGGYYLYAGPYNAKPDGWYRDHPGDKIYTIFKDESGQLVLSEKPDYDPVVRRYKTMGCVFPVMVTNGTMLDVTPPAASTSR